MTCFRRLLLAVALLVCIPALWAGEPSQVMLHGDPINAIAISPDGKRAASVGDDRLVRIWDLASGEELFVLRGHHRTVVGVAFSPDGKQLATACHGGIVRIWDVASGKQLRAWRAHERAVLCLAWSPDGTSLATGSEDCTLATWNPTNGERRLLIADHREANHPCPWVESVVFSPDSRLLCTGSHDNSIRVFDATTGTKQQRWVAEAGVVAVRMSADGSRLASVGYRDRTISIWSLGSSPHKKIIHRAGNLGLAFSPDGKTLATGGNDYRVYLWDVSTGKQLARFRVHEKLVSAIAFTPDGKSLVTASFDGMLKVWDWKAKIHLPVSFGQAK